MFSGTIEIKRLRKEDVNEAVTRQINKLLRHQHSKANQTTTDDVRERLKSMHIVLAWSDENVVGMISAPMLPPLSHTVASIHNPIVLEGFDVGTIKQRLFEMVVSLTPGPLYNYVDHIVDEDDEVTQTIMHNLGFRLRKGKLLYRLKC